jgi:hypothetical protein
MRSLRKVLEISGDGMMIQVSGTVIGRQRSVLKLLAKSMKEVGRRVRRLSSAPHDEIPRKRTRRALSADRVAVLRLESSISSPSSSTTSSYE